MLNVLFLDSGNTSHSLIAESILRANGRGRFHAWSAGCLSAGVVNQEVLAFLQERNLPVEGLRSKGLREVTAGASFSFVITLSGLAAATTQERTFPGDPVVAHWHLDDEDEGDAEPSVWALRDSYWILSRRIKIFASLPHGKASRQALENRLHALESWQ